MTKKKTSAAVHIPREHQSAPKEHWADKEVRLAAEEIREGKFVPEDDDDFLAVGLQRGRAIRHPGTLTGAEKMDLADETRDSIALSQHPRVQEALRRFQEEKTSARTPQEVLEKTQMLHEMNERAQQCNKWDGQGRWMGKDSEDMRVVNIMTPMHFLQKLEAVIGEKRVFLNRFAVAKRVALLVPDKGEKSRVIIPGQPAPRHTIADDFLQVGTLQFPCGPEWMVPRFDEYGIITTAKYLGWRTALLSMIDLGVISEKEAHKAFPLVQNEASAWYREQLFMIRGRDGAMN